MQMTLICLLSSMGYGFTLDESPLIPHAQLLTAEVHPECEKVLLTDDGVERSTYKCRGLVVFNSYEILSNSLEVRLSNYPSQAEFLSPSLPLQEGWILDHKHMIPVKSINSPTAKYFVNLQNNKVVYVEDHAFDVARVYVTNSRKRETSEVETPQKSPSGFLDTDFFSVSSAVSERVKISPEMFFSPETESSFFDQVQIFWRLDQITKWFQNHGVKLNDKVEVRIHLYGVEDINNGSYTPESGNGPLIKIGQGDSIIMTDLARDLDVITHEYSHHLIFQTLKTARGESGILHEGYADYFAFAMGEDPNLAETIMVSGFPLRTALLPPEYKFHREGKDWSKHMKSQFFSRLLWLLRETYGEGYDQTVFQSLKFLKPESSLHDAIHALLLASPGESERCKTMELAQSLGFDEALQGIDGSACGFQFGAPTPEKKSSTRNIIIDRKVFGCAAASAQHSNPGILLLLLPLLASQRWQQFKNPFKTKKTSDVKRQNHEI